MLSACWLPPASATPPPITVEAIYGGNVGDDVAGDYLAGIKLTLGDGWKTAWRNPGAAGKPFSLKWNERRNVKSVRMSYPTPKRFYIGELWSIGYENEVVFPLLIAPKRADATTELVGEVFFIACKEQCIPIKQAVELRLPVAEVAGRDLIEKYRRLVPKAPGKMRITAADLGNRRLEVTAVAAEPFVSPQLFTEGRDWAESLSPPQVKTDRERAVFTFTFAEPPPRPLAAIKFTLSNSPPNGVTAIYQEVTPTPTAAQGLWWILPLALLGGLILNLMPCVLPVLGLKLLGAVQATRSVRLGFLQGAAGIFCSFFLLWAATFTLKMLGKQVGWGFQFQQPQFLAVMALVMTLFAASFFGKLQIRLPRFIKIKANSPFAYGVFATVLATPCSAPFVGSAVGYALAAEQLTALAVFMTMALGFASPWLAAAAVPQSAIGIVPKSGEWNHRLRMILGYLLVATVVWLLSLVYEESGAVAIGLAALLGGILFVPSLRRGWFIGVVAAFSLLLQAKPLVPPLGDRWLVFDEARLGELVGQGELVFVDVTAKWCLTCLLNKRVLNGEPFRRATVEAVLMRADWTLGDPKITAWMAKYGRQAVPFNIVFGPGAKAGIILSELLRERSVLAAIAAADIGNPGETDEETRRENVGG